MANRGIGHHLKYSQVIKLVAGSQRAGMIDVLQFYKWLGAEFL